MSKEEFIKSIKWFLNTGTKKYKKTHKAGLINEGLFRFDEMISDYNASVSKSKSIPHLQNIQVFPADVLRYSLKDFQKIGKSIINQKPCTVRGKVVY